MRGKQFRTVKTGLAIAAVVGLAQFVATAAGQDSGPPARAKAPNFRLVSVATRGASSAYRFNPTTGDTWTYNANGSNWYWLKLSEPGPLVSGNYDVQAKAYVANKTATSVSIRLERTTGQVWYSGGLDWSALSEPGGAPPAQAPSEFRLVMSASASDWAAFRFNPQTGDTWTPNVSGTNRSLQKIADSQQLPAGDYDVQTVVSTSNNMAAKVAVRIERKTGRTWVTNKELTAWDAIAEPQGTAINPAAHGFKLIITASSVSWLALRFNPQTGDAWGLVISASGPAWLKVQDSAQLPAGRYDLQIVSYVNSKRGLESVFRIERNSGQCWSLNGPSWTAVTEPSAAPALPASTVGYRLLMTAAAGMWDAYRWDPAGGNVWKFTVISGAPAWQLMQDSPATTPGDYDLQVAAYTANNSMSEMAFRIDRKSGWYWISTDLSSWDSVAEDASFPTPPLPKAGFRLVAGASKVSWDAYRFNPETGETWQPFYQGVAFISIELTDPAPVPRSDYDVQMTSTEQNNVGSTALIRIDRQSGQSWHKVDSQWQPIAENAPAPAGN